MNKSIRSPLNQSNNNNKYSKTTNCGSNYNSNHNNKVRSGSCSSHTSERKSGNNSRNSCINNSSNNNGTSNSNINSNNNSTINNNNNNTINSNNNISNSNSNDDYYSILEDLAKSEKTKFRSVKDSMDENLNLEFLRSSSENYTYKITSRGPVCYSAIYRDDKYVYRHVILSDNVRQYAENKVRKTNAFLTEHCIVNELQIDIGKGWKHFMIYDGKIRELILRKVLTAEDKLRMAVHTQKYN
ncbi:cyclin-dependent kinases regulatory subunit, putative [Plasmodium malariae]|uniref:Cyclin-dependent kinases regulatory subunit n=1 Tax=Plasmodium malariae TaxID=5858 RepID=A0A1C3KBR6_PLAMA|nr:cyclin-dependent kinases regulatory subunit, putative [Plasmodium malariae]